VAALDAAVWVTGPDRTIHWLNEKAGSLLSVAPGQVLGRRCHQVVAAEDLRGRPFCRPDCPVLDSIRRGTPLPPFRLRLGVRARDQESHSVRVLMIPVRRPRDAGVFVVHCVVSCERETRMERYLRSVAGRWTSRRVSAERRAAGALTPREKEVLDFLSRDEELHSIARRLGVSYVTVRNHVQHILGKMGVHSIEEAVARVLLE
jgi:DNA-binding CsgD family transcriptional regulator